MWLPALAVGLACALGFAIGWALLERWKRKRITRQRNDAIRDVARLRDQLGVSRRLNRPRDPAADLMQLRMEQRLGYAVQRPDPSIVVTNPLA
jgi:uncharacterized membrane protein YccC